MARTDDLSPPPSVKEAETSMELLRVWIVDKRLEVVLSGNLWKDSASWGLLLVDLARHVANAYEEQGHDREAVLARIREGFDAEWRVPTDEPGPRT